MNIQECYRKLGGNFQDVMTRLPSVSLVERFIGKFLEDQTFETLCRKMEEGNRNDAFVAVHTLKGVSGNLAFTALFEASSRLTEELRGTDAITPKAVSLLEEVKERYANTVNVIREYLTTNVR